MYNICLSFEGQVWSFVQENLAKFLKVKLSFLQKLCNIKKLRYSNTVKKCNKHVATNARKE